jgi:hypothetical protein
VDNRQWKGRKKIADKGPQLVAKRKWKTNTLKYGTGGDE